MGRHGFGDEVVLGQHLGSCTASALKTPWPAEVTGSGGNGTLTVQHPGAKFTCGGRSVGLPLLLDCVLVG